MIAPNSSHQFIAVRWPALVTLKKNPELPIEKGPFVLEVTGSLPKNNW